MLARYACPRCEREREECDMGAYIHTDAPQTQLCEATHSGANYKTRPRLKSLFSLSDICLMMGTRHELFYRTQSGGRHY